MKASLTNTQFQVSQQRQPTGSYFLAQMQGQKRGVTQAQPGVTPQPQDNTRFIGARHSSRVTSVAWSVRGGHIASASYDKTVKVWDASEGETY